MQRYKSLQTKKPEAKRARKSAHGSRLPYWLAKQPAIQKFMRMSRKKKLAIVGAAGASVLIITALFTTVYFASSLGSKERIMNRNKTGVTLLDRNGEEFYRFYDARSDTHVPLDQIALVAQQAVVSAEDKNFFDHPGFSPVGIGGAVWQNLRPGGLNNGGSTITQQLVKTALLSQDRSLIRKYQELILSIEIERRYSKDEILEMYLNSVYFGEGAFGIEDAARTYFNKSAADLNTAEAALLAGLLPAPSAYSPISGSLEMAKQRQTYVLQRMKEDGHLNEDQLVFAQNTPLTFSTIQETQNFKAPHFALMVMEELKDKYGEETIARSGYRVTTSLDLGWQAQAESAVANQVDSLRYSQVSNGAAVVLDPANGEIRALVGSRDWNNELYGKLNIATATRQPGSTFKAIVYATGIENKDFSSATLWQDKQTDFGGYIPQNYDRRFRGEVTTRRALATSLNVPAVAALQKTGIDKVTKEAEELGVSTLDSNVNYGLPMALGSAPAKLTEMTNVYATFANQGKLNDTTTLHEINDKNDQKIYTNKPRDKQVISSQTSYIMSSMMSDSTARSEMFGSSLNLYGNRVAAVKTGTTEDYRDAWTIGYTPSIAVGVWIGNNDNSPMSSIAGSSGAAPIWRSIMENTLANTSFQEFTVPSGLTSRTICRANGALAQTAGANTLNEYFIPGTLPTTTCNAQVEVPKQEAPVPTQNNQPPEDDEAEEEQLPPEPETPPAEETPTPETPPAQPITNP